ncbi:uncharacterized protein EI90DRAFT_3132862 [Cantharellus anzutake]|uniref:uncharacterized protein n=1 Tax=Cantharellus anzutake TaxID=1750568 RepID=UPI001906BD7E|nr:uncharacterized protein EI90DRAFT_3132862 [Cantharellus anzutake]KAF8319164.1 hypothetical protein EI90DRAFT_3132862 [Cantharellus anzutake]
MPSKTNKLGQPCYTAAKYSSDADVAEWDESQDEEGSLQGLQQFWGAFRVQGDQVKPRSLQNKEMVPYLIKYQRLPEPAKMKKIGAGSLLDNEAVVMGVHRYLAQMNIGQITPHLLAKHINEELLPKLQADSPPKENIISECAAQRWLWKLGYRSVESRKGAYIDGHEQPDVIESHKKFIQSMSREEGIGK